MRIRNQVRLELAHHVLTENNVGTGRFHVYKAWADRPAAGVRTGRMRCGTCGEMVGFRIHSRTETWARKRRRLAFAPGAAVPLVAAILVGYQLPSEGVSDWVISVLAVVTAISLVTLVTSLLLSLLENGVLVDHARRNGPHRFNVPINTTWSPMKEPAPFETSLTFDD